MSRRVDIEALLDYLIFNIVIDNSDWPGNNLVRFRERVANGKWRYLPKDLDFAFGMFQVAGTWNTGDPSQNALARVLDPFGPGFPNPPWATLPFRKALDNAGFRTRFVNRLADMLNTVFTRDRIVQRINEFHALYLPEMQTHLDRWAAGWNVWDSHVEKMRIFAGGRADFVRTHTVSQFPEVTGTAQVTVQIEPPQGGVVTLNTITAASGWQGRYFTGVNIPLKATASTQYQFDGWSLAALGNAAATLSLTSDMVMTAKFKRR